MSNTTYPTSIDTPTNPLATDGLSSVPHHSQHSFENDAIVALETKVGADGSAVTSTHDYKLSGVTGSDKAVSKTGIETLTQKTLTSPKINVGSDATGDMYYRDSGGAFVRLPAGTDGQIISYLSGLPTTIANPAASDASTSVKGVVEEATQAEVDAGTSGGGTSAPLFINPSNLRARLLNTGVLDTGTTNAYVITPSPAITAYATYQEFTFKAASTNTGASTINVSGLGTKTIKRMDGLDVKAGDIVSGRMYKIVYDGTNFELISAITNGLPVWRTVAGTQVLTSGTSTSWADVDVSSVVGANACLVIFTADVAASVSGGSSVFFRTKGSAIDYPGNSVGTSTFLSNGVGGSSAGTTANTGIVILPTDSNGFIQYKVGGASMSANLFVLGYIL